MRLARLSLEAQSRPQSLRTGSQQCFRTPVTLAAKRQRSRPKRRSCRPRAKPRPSPALSLAASALAAWAPAACRASPPLSIEARSAPPSVPAARATAAAPTVATKAMVLPALMRVWAPLRPERLTLPPTVGLSSVSAAPGGLPLPCASGPPRAPHEPQPPHGLRAGRERQRCTGRETGRRGPRCQMHWSLASAEARSPPATAIECPGAHVPTLTLRQSRFGRRPVVAMPRWRPHCCIPRWHPTQSHPARPASLHTSWLLLCAASCGFRAPPPQLKLKAFQAAGSRRPRQRLRKARGPARLGRVGSLGQP